jgi:hypothetical protein
MRSLPLLFALATVLLAGCASLATRVQERFATVAPNTREFDGDPRTTYYAARTAFKRLDFVLAHALPGSANLEAGSRIHPSDALGDSRQLVAQVHLSEVAPGRTEVAVRLVEQVENASLGGLGQRPLREHAFYETFFATLAAVLQEQTAVAPDREN